MAKHERQLTPLEQILEDSLNNVGKCMWDSMIEIGGLKEDIAMLNEFLPRFEAIYRTLASLQVEIATIRIDMDKRKSKRKQRTQ